MWLRQDALTYSIPEGAKLILADPVYSNEQQLLHVESLVRADRAVVMFCYPEDLKWVHPDQVCHWVKPVSTKNTAKRYSRFVEAICIWHGPYFNSDLHWSNRTGVFTDALLEQPVHPWKKPLSLIQRLVALHSQPGDLVIDLFAGSGTTADACSGMGRPCISVEIDPAWLRSDARR